MKNLDELLMSRRSIRKYQPDRSVSEETLLELIRAAQMAPTWKNSQTGRYYIAASREAVEAVRDMLPGFNQRNSANACAYIVTTFLRDVSGFTQGQPDNELGNEWGAYDLGLQNSYLILKASDLGLDTLIMGLRDADALRRYFDIPQEEELAAVISVGYREQDPVFGGRKPLDEIIKIR